MIILEIMSVVVAVIIFDYADYGHLLVNLFKMFGVNAFMKLDEIIKGIVLAKLHLVAEVNHLGGKNLAQAPVFGIVGGNSAYFMNYHIGDFFTELYVVFLNVFFVLIFAFYGFALLKHISTSRKVCG